MNLKNLKRIDNAKQSELSMSQATCDHLKINEYPGTRISHDNDMIFRVNDLIENSNSHSRFFKDNIQFFSRSRLNSF